MNFKLNKHAPVWLSKMALDHPLNNRIKRVYIYHQENNEELTIESQRYINEQLRIVIRDKICNTTVGPFDFKFTNEVKMEEESMSMFVVKQTLLTKEQTISLPLHILALQIGKLCGYAKVECKYMVDASGNKIVDTNTFNKKTDTWEGWESN